ncbi:hypothetical protein [Nocardia sp. NPDC004860]|uniref:hypothetical protein n=1 Tax=Nocardia sp. NPDC004860 TaxID=3154557 RepID=UPI0033BD1465
MTRFNVFLFALVVLGVALLSAPQFVASLLIGAGVIVFGLRWFVRSSRRGWRR